MRPMADEGRFLECRENIKAGGAVFRCFGVSRSGLSPALCFEGWVAGARLSAARKEATAYCADNL